MKAVRLLEYGGELVFSDVPTPTIASDEVLVKIKSTVVNHLDLVEASGSLKGRPRSERRMVLSLSRRNTITAPPRW